MTRRPWGVVTDQGRVVRQDVLDAYVIKAQVESRQLPEEESWQQVRGLLRPHFDPGALAKAIDANTAHARACRQKAVDVAGGGWRFDRVDEAADDADRLRLKGWFDRLPAPTNALDDDDLGDVLTSCQLDYEAMGRAVLEVIREDHAATGPVATVAHMPAWSVRVHRDKIRFAQIRGGRTRWYKWIGAPYDVDYESGELRELGDLRPERRATEVIWWREYHPLDKTYGGPDVLPALGAIHGDAGRRDFNISFFSNWGIPAYAIFVSGDFDPGKMVDAKGKVVDDDDESAVMTEVEWHIESLLDRARQNPHSSMVFTVPTREGENDGKVEVRFEPLATDVKEASFRLYRRDNREEILSAHGMSAAVAGVFDQGVANRESMAHYQRSVVTPRRSKIEKAINRYLVEAAFGVTGWRWKLVGLDTRDVAREIELWLSMLDRGVVTVREILQHFGDALGLPQPGEGGDPALDMRRHINAPAEGGDGDGDQVAAALRSLRDDLVTVAAKADAARLPTLADSLLG